MVNGHDNLKSLTVARAFSKGGYDRGTPFFKGQGTGWVSAGSVRVHCSLSHGCEPTKTDRSNINDLG